MPKIHFGVQYNGVSMSSVIGPLEFARKTEALASAHSRLLPAAGRYNSCPLSSRGGWGTAA